MKAPATRRCIRCGHPFESGKHGSGEWSPCDEQCAHGGPLRSVEINRYVGLVDVVAGELVKQGEKIEAGGRILAVHGICLQCKKDTA